MKKFIALMLAMILMLAMLASCTKNKDTEGKEDPPVTEKADYDTFISDMEKVYEKFSKEENFVITIGGKSELKFPSSTEDPAPETTSDLPAESDKVEGTIDSSIKIVKSGNSYRIYGSLDGKDLIDPSDSSVETFNVVFKDGKLYVVTSEELDDVKAVIDISEEDIKNIANKIEEMLKQTSADSQPSDDIIDKITESFKDVDFSECETVQEMLKIIIDKVLPIYLEEKYGKDWEKALKDLGVTFEDISKSYYDAIVGEIPQEAWDILNGDVLKLLRSDSEFVEFTKTTQSGNTTYDFKVKKELFEEIAKIGKKILAMVDPDASFESEFQDITYSVKFDSDSRLLSLSSSIGGSVTVDKEEIKFKDNGTLTISYTSEEISAPEVTSEFEKISNEEAMAKINEIIEDMFNPDQYILE